MRDLYLAVVWLAAAAHFAFLAYLAAGGFLALRWRRTIWIHVPAVLWALGSMARHFECPLTNLEQWARARAGLAPLNPTGFIDHYITGVLFPAGGASLARAAVLLAIAVSWVLYVRTGRRVLQPR